MDVPFDFQIIFFDPSYGTTTTGATDRIRRFNRQNANVSFYATLNNVAPGAPNFFYFKPVDPTVPAIEANIGIQNDPSYTSPQ